MHRVFLTSTMPVQNVLQAESIWRGMWQRTMIRIASGAHVQSLLRWNRQMPGPQPEEENCVCFAAVQCMRDLILVPLPQ